MTEVKIATREEWLEARKALLAKEKEHTRFRDQLTKQRQALPWVAIDKPYVFDTEADKASLLALFGAHSQLIVYHFMFGLEWQEGCKSCSFWADSFNGLEPHLNGRDIAFAVVSRAPMSKLLPFKRRMGWDFSWVSSEHNSFNEDFGVGFKADRPAEETVTYNYNDKATFPMDEAHGTSVFVRDENDNIYHTYSTYGRGLDITNAAYSYIDLTPNGRAEDGLGNPMSWVRHHDSYSS